MSWVWLAFVLGTARMTPLWTDLIEVMFLSIVVALALVEPALFALLVLLLPHARSTVPRPPPLVSGYFFECFSEEYQPFLL